VLPHFTRSSLEERGGTRASFLFVDEDQPSLSPFSFRPPHSLDRSSLAPGKRRDPRFFHHDGGVSPFFFFPSPFAAENCLVPLPRLGRQVVPAVGLLSFLLPLCLHFPPTERRGALRFSCFVSSFLFRTSFCRVPTCGRRQPLSESRVRAFFFFFPRHVAWARAAWTLSSPFFFSRTQNSSFSSCSKGNTPFPYGNPTIPVLDPPSLSHDGRRNLLSFPFFVSGGDRVPVLPIPFN